MFSVGMEVEHWLKWVSINSEYSDRDAFMTLSNGYRGYS